jgi:adenylate cyclase
MLQIYGQFVKMKSIALKYLIHLELLISPNLKEKIKHPDNYREAEKLLILICIKMLEIERKFLVTSDSYKKGSFSKKRIIQGYLSSNPERTVRVRIKENKAYLTIKGASNATGMSRFEWEKEIPVEEAENLLLLCEKGVIDKTRFEVKVGNHTYEVDEFYGENEGLEMAEIELQSETELFEKPSWLGVEVTNDERYYNSYLSKNPYKNW